ncbi:MAG: ABC transporter permease [Vicinamibacterales bacterium]
MQDLRDAVRTFRSSPMLTAAAILSLTLGIGANTAIFSILNSLLLKPLPVRDPGTLIALASDAPGEDAAMTYPVWREIHDRQILNDAFVWASDRVTGAVDGNPQPLETIWASGRFFDVLGLSMSAGRAFGEMDDRRGGGREGPVAVLSHRTARRLFGRPSAAIGQTLTLERIPFTIVGVTPAGFSGLNIGSDLDVVVPLDTEPMLNRIPSRTSMWPWLHVTGRLTPATTPDDATAIMRAVQPRIRDATMPGFERAEDRENYLRKPWTMRSAATGNSRLRSRYRSALVTLFATSALVLLAACVNIAHLQLARTATRRYEFGVRLALGASRLRIVRLELIESLLLASIGAALGLALAQSAGAVVVAQLSTWASTAFLDLGPDWRVLAVTMALTMITAVLFGTLPAIRAARVDPIATLNTGRRGQPSAGFGIAGDVLVVAQVALALVLITGAALFVRSLATLVYRDLGFDRDRVLTVLVDARRSAIQPEARGALFERVRQAVSSIPGVESAATSMATPLGSAGIRFLNHVGEPGNPTLSQRNVRLLMNPISSGWFRTFGTRLMAGRDFDQRDTGTSARVGIINDAFARRHFAGTNPIGRTLMVGSADDDRTPMEIVGIVEDAAFTSVREPVEPTLYRPIAQLPAIAPEVARSFPAICLSLRSAAGMAPARLSNSVSAAVAGVDDTLTLSFQAMTETLSVYYIRERLLALVSGYFGSFALLLGAIGVYGVIAYAVNRRRTEIGIRMAIGASAPAVVRLVVRRAALLVAVGVVVGCLATAWASRLIQALLFNTEARDPAIVLTSSVALVLAAACAAWIPARRAARIDPAAVLREG